jgi:salicylate hydroxylase
MLENPDLKAYPQWHHAADAPTYTKGAVCIMGDAAHAMTPWQGSGAGQAIEDAMVLETVLASVTSKSQIGVALKAYDHVRRPRTQRIVHSSWGTGLILCGRGEGIGLDIEEMRGKLPQRWGFIHGLDLKAHRREALEVMGRDLGVEEGRLDEIEGGG